MYFHIKKLSAKRTQIMGAAMLLVVFFYSSFEFGAVPPLQFIKSISDVGVDCFLLVSGLGIYFSLNRNSDIPNYLTRRIKRIVPAYLLVNGLWFVLMDFILNPNGIGAFLFDLSSLSFWFKGQLTTWYLSALLLLQILTPGYIRLWKKHKSLNQIAIVVILMICIIIRLLPGLNDAVGHLLIFMFRIPIYLLGLSLGARLCGDQEYIKVPICLGLLLLFACIYILLSTGNILSLYTPWAFRYAAFIPIAFLLSYGITMIPNNRILTFFGERSLEIYLLHEKVLWILGTFVHKFVQNNKNYTVVINLLALLATCIGAEILHRFLRWMLCVQHRKD